LFTFGSNLEHFSSDFGVNVVITPSITRLIDMAPYNTFILNCSGIMLTQTAQSKLFTWKKVVNDIASNVTHDGDSVNVTNSNLEGISSTSILQVRENVYGDYTYICSVATEHERQDATALVIVGGE